MTRIFRLVDSTAGTPVTIDFLAGPIYADIGEWDAAPNVQSVRYSDAGGYGIYPRLMGFSPARESFLAWANTTTPAIIDELIKFDTLMETARWYWSDRRKQNAVWLEVQTDNQATIRRSLVVTGSHADRSSRLAPTSMLRGTQSPAQWTISLTHHPQWECATADDHPFDVSGTPTEEVISTVEDSTWLLVENPSTIPARISWLEAYIDGNPQLINRLWVGVHWTRYGDDLSVFDATIDLSGSNTTPEASATYVADAAAINGNAYQIDLSSPALAKRLTVLLINPMSGEIPVDDAWAGSYRLLARYRVTGTAVVGIQAYYGVVGAMEALSEIYNIGGDLLYHLVDLGEITYPVGVRFGDLTPFAAYLYLYAELLSGSGYLVIDALCLVPSNHLLVVDGAAISGSLVHGESLVVSVDPRDFTYAGDRVVDSAESQPYAITTKDFYIPLGTNYFVIFADDLTNGNLLASEITVSMEVVNRWRSVSESAT